jgi:hypothetical protein
MNARLALVMLSIASVFVVETTTLPADALEPPGPLVEFLGVDNCINVPPDATLNFGAGMTTDGSTWPYAKLPLPPNAKPIFFNGTLGCARHYVVEIPVTKASLPKTATQVHWSYAIGGRNNVWPKPTAGTAPIDVSGFDTGCKWLDGACYDKVMPDLCHHMVLTVSQAWKKSGEAKFTFIRSTAFSMTYDRPTASCQLDTPGPGNENYTHLVTQTQDQVTASGVYRIPPVGQTDVYRVIIAASYARNLVEGNGGLWPSWVSGVKTSYNPIAQQYPVGVFLRP